MILGHSGRVGILSCGIVQFSCFASLPVRCWRQEREPETPPPPPASPPQARTNERLRFAPAACSLARRRPR